MTWQNQDNKNQRGLIDQIFVSPSEDYELRHFVDHYLQSNNFEVSGKNRQIVRDAIAEFPGAAPVRRNALTTFLNNKFRR